MAIDPKRALWLSEVKSGVLNYGFSFGSSSMCLPGMKMDKIYLEDCKVIFQLVEEGVIRKLYLQYAIVVDDIVKQFSEKLKKNITLEELTLGGIGFEGVMAIVEALKENRSVRMIHLCPMGGRFSERDCSRIIDMLRANTSLTYIHHNIPFNSEQQLEVEKLLARNKKLFEDQAKTTKDKPDTDTGKTGVDGAKRSIEHPLAMAVAPIPTDQLSASPAPLLILAKPKPAEHPKEVSEAAAPILRPLFIKSELKTMITDNCDSDRLKAHFRQVKMDKTLGYTGDDWLEFTLAAARIKDDLKRLDLVEFFAKMSLAVTLEAIQPAPGMINTFMRTIS